MVEVKLFETPGVAFDYIDQQVNNSHYPLQTIIDLSDSIKIKYEVSTGYILEINFFKDTIISKGINEKNCTAVEIIYCNRNPEVKSVLNREIYRYDPDKGFVLLNERSTKNRHILAIDPNHTIYFTTMEMDPGIITL